MRVHAGVSEYLDIAWPRGSESSYRRFECVDCGENASVDDICHMSVNGVDDICHIAMA